MLTGELVSFEILLVENQQEAMAPISYGTYTPRKRLWALTTRERTRRTGTLSIRHDIINGQE